MSLPLRRCSRGGAWRSASCSRVAVLIARGRRGDRWRRAAVGARRRGDALWAAGHLEKSREVTTSGPVPVHAASAVLGSSIMALGVAVASPTLVAGAADGRSIWPRRSPPRSGPRRPFCASGSATPTTPTPGRAGRRWRGGFSCGARAGATASTAPIAGFAVFVLLLVGRMWLKRSRRDLTGPKLGFIVGRFGGASGDEPMAGRLAQLVEHRLYTPAVTGSSPVPPTQVQVQSCKVRSGG